MKYKLLISNKIFWSKWLAIVALWLSLCNIPGNNHPTIIDAIKTELIELPYSQDIHKKLDWSFLNFDLFSFIPPSSFITQIYLSRQSQTHTHIKFIQSLKKFDTFKSNILFIQILPQIHCSKILYL